jgi:hypothetical protein
MYLTSGASRPSQRLSFSDEARFIHLECLSVEKLELNFDQLVVRKAGLRPPVGEHSTANTDT